MRCLSEFDLTLSGGTDTDAASDVVDIFTVLPPQSEDGKKKVFAPSLLDFLISTATRNRSTSPRPQPEETDPNAKSMEMAYKTVRRSRVGQISCALNRDERSWKAAKAVMG